MELFKGSLYGTDIKVLYHYKRIEIIKYSDKKRIFSYKDNNVTLYLPVILSNLIANIHKTLREMKSSTVINIDSLEINKDYIKNEMELNYSNSIHYIDIILNYYSDYIISPSLLARGSIKPNMYLDIEVNIQKYKGLLIDNKKLIVENIYLIPDSKYNIFKFYFSSEMLLLKIDDVLRYSKLADEYGDDIEMNELEVNMFKGD